MAKVKRIEEEIEKLSPAEFAELRDWLLEKDWEQWDRQIEQDAAAGRLDELFEKALAGQIGAMSVPSSALCSPSVRRLEERCRRLG